MKISSLYRSIRPMVSSLSTYVDPFYGPQHTPLAKGYAKTLPPSYFSSWKTSSMPGRNERPTTYKILGSGMILLKNYVSLENQIDIVNTCQKWGMAGGFHKPVQLQRYVMCLGRNWDPETGYKERYTTKSDLPQQLISLAEAAVQDAQTPHLNPNELPSMRPDTCLVNYYPTHGLSELHQDRDESFDSISSGLPVVYISIGEMAEFVYSHVRDESKLNTIFLRSGDVLIYGGKSRLIYHGVTQIAQYTSPLLGLGGHISLTFRQF
ncbi:hypothetical protein SSX86_024197 [Deinandra increscens subsp. villosa]|uniref:Fe2OG dioxygenase domain-containing protein n=1 Tax=Deinandra increscens subsp. villosa TaxID=3103831 RepID=A0AAP0GNF9_9ASTR